MIIQSIIIKPTEIGGKSYGEMYFRGGNNSGGAIHIKENERFSLDTYFGSFAYTIYQKYTKIDKILVNLQLTGKAKISICTYDGKNESVIAQKIDSGCVCFEIFLGSLPENAILYPVIEPLCDLLFLGGDYSTSIELQKPSIAVAMCTYKREGAVLKSIEVLKNSKHIDKAFIIDNGQSLDLAINDSKITVLPNKNLGGSGGFTRGLIEAQNYSYIILMDDDVIFDSELFLRMSALLSSLKDEYKGAHISASMLYSTTPCIQHEMGARFTGNIIKSFKQGLDITCKDTLVQNLALENVEYGAWWCYALPNSDIFEHALPFPFFIKFDDVEYGTRCCSESAPIITLSGICVWHDDFDLKYSMHLDYYTIRNQLITLAAHGKQTRLGAILRLIKVTCKNLFLYRYDNMPIAIKAFEDFLKGAPFLLYTNEEELNKEIMALAPKATPLSQLDGWYDGAREDFCARDTALGTKILQLLTLGGHILPSFMLKKKTAIFPLASTRLSYAFLNKKTIQYQLGSDFGYAYNRSFKSFIRYSFKSAWLALKLLFTYGKAKTSYKDSKALLTSVEFWKKHLELEK